MRSNCSTEEVIIHFIQSDSLDSKPTFFCNKSDVHLMCLAAHLQSSFWFIEGKDLTKVLSRSLEVFMECRLDKALPSTLLPSHHVYICKI